MIMKASSRSGADFSRSARLMLWTLLLVTLAIVAPALAAPSVTRSLPASALAGSTIGVNLTVLLDNASYYAIDEIVPANWTVTGASGGGDWTSQPGHVKWVCIQDCGNVTYSYNVTIPTGANGTYTFSGTWAMEGVNETPIGGATSITVMQPLVPDFTIGLSPSSRSIQQGSSSTATVTVTAIAGYNQIVELTALGVPANVIVSFSPVSIVPTSTSTMTIVVASGAAIGTTSLTVRARGEDGKEHNATFSLAVTAPPPAAVCGNGIIESGESCDGTNLGGKTCAKLGYVGGTLACAADCKFNAAGCTSGGGGGGGVIGVTTQMNVVQDAANLTISSVAANAPVWWNVNQPAKIPITALNLTAKAAQQNVLIQMRAYATKPAADLRDVADVVYRWVGVTSSIADANLSAVRIGFAVSNAWIDETDVDEKTIALYRYVGTVPVKLNTSWVGKDADWTYYESAAPGLSIFAIAALRPACPPACPEPTEWSACSSPSPMTVAGTQSRTEYECSAATGYECAAKTVTRNCCPSCPSPGNWSACAAGQQNRASYRCSDATGYKCEQYTETRSCVDAVTASEAISRAQSAIASARQAGKNVTSAEALLAQAQTAFAVGNYEGAQNFAVQAESAAAVALPLPAPILPIESIAVIAVALAVVGIALLLKRHKAPPAAICIVCGQSTTLRMRCSSCGQYACVAHMRMIAGRPYCSNCVRRMYG